MGVERHGMAWTLLDSGWQDRSFRRPTVFSAGQWSPARDCGLGGDHLRWLLASAVTSAVSGAIALAIRLPRGPQRQACCSPHPGQPVFGLRYAEVEREETSVDSKRM